jgi:RHS repeat-associated protein
MRARYYSPELMRFVNADTYKGTIANSPTLNNYAYANGNPISLIDPFGRCAGTAGVHFLAG